MPPSMLRAHQQLPLKHRGAAQGQSSLQKAADALHRRGYAVKLPVPLEIPLHIYYMAIKSQILNAGGYGYEFICTTCKLHM